MEKVLIIPAASYKKEYEERIPEIFRIHENGYINLLNNMKGLPLDEFDIIYIILNDILDKKYNISAMLNPQLYNMGILNKTRVATIETTRNVVETIIQALFDIHKDVSVFIKDADASFNISELNNESTVYTYLLEDVDNICPSSKSYVTKTSDDIVLNIIEKRVISSEFCAGGYYFNNSDTIFKCWAALADYDKLYLSNLIFYDIINNNEMYRAELVNDFNE